MDKTLFKKSITDFIRLEDGKLGKRNALMLGSVLGATALGQMLLGTVDNAEATATHSQYTAYHRDASF